MAQGNEAGDVPQEGKCARKPIVTVTDQDLFARALTVLKDAAITIFLLACLSHCTFGWPR